jgi:parvulin-like peptidyl-prolyl isomerase
MVRTVVSVVLMAIVIGCSKKPKEGVAVIVNGHEILMTNVMQAAEMLHQTYVAAYPEKALEGMTPELLSGAAQQLVANKLLVEEAQKQQIVADPAAVDSALEQVVKRFPDRAAFERELTKMNETEANFRAQIAEGVRLEKLMHEIFATAKTIDSAQCRSFYEENKAEYVGAARVRGSQIFLPFTDASSEEERDRVVASARALRGQLVAGASFADLAKKHSRGPGAAEGGDIGWFKKGDLRPDLEAPLFALGKGEVGDLITTDVGVFIVKKTDEEAQTQLPFEEVSGRIRFLLEIRERNALISRYIDDLVAKANVVWVDERLKPFAAAATTGAFGLLPQGSGGD